MVLFLWEKKEAKTYTIKFVPYIHYFFSFLLNLPSLLFSQLLQQVKGMNIQRMSSSLHKNYINTTQTSPILYSSFNNNFTSSSNSSTSPCINNNMSHPSSFHYSDHHDYLKKSVSDHPDNDPLNIINSTIIPLTSSSWGSSVDSFHVDNLHTLLDLLDDDPSPTQTSFLHNNNFQDKYGGLFEYFSDDILPNNIDHEIIKRSEVSTLNPNKMIELDCQSNNEEMKSNSQNKQRIRWTTELHDLFLDAIQTLGGPELATPKKILGIMNVKSLSIYHVKSHLQKYRLAKNNVPELKLEKKDSSSSTENKETYHNNDSVSSNDNINMPVTQALRMQIELQKLLHDQLKAHRDLQLSIEQNAEFLRKLIEKQNNPKTKAASSPIIINNLSDSD